MLRKAIELIELLLLRLTAMMADVISLWTYTQRMPGTKCFEKLIELIELLLLRLTAMMADVISRWTYTQRMPGIQCF